MAENSNLAPCCYLIVCAYLLCFCCHWSSCEAAAQDGGGEASGRLYNSYMISSFTYSKTVLQPYEWRYIRVDLPLRFSSMSLALESDVDINSKIIQKIPKSSLPMICLRQGSPPLPDLYNNSLTGLVMDSISNISSKEILNLQFIEQCYPMQKNVSLTLTNEQISHGVLYFGLFNGIGPIRTQSKMINRGPSYSFSGNVSVEGCTVSMIWGQYCNQTIDPLSCIEIYNLTKGHLDIESYNQTTTRLISCESINGKSCHKDNELKVYSLDLDDLAEMMSIAATNVTNDNSGIVLMCYARLGAMPIENLYDYSGNISHAPLVIHTPKIGRWYISIQPVHVSNKTVGVQDMNIGICYSLNWEMLQCPVDKAGFNCTWERYMLQTVLRKNPSVPFESYYLPITGKVSSDSANFPLEPLLSNSSFNGIFDFSWTYFTLEVPSGAAGGNVHIRLTSDTKIHQEIYVKYGGLPTLGGWDYYYANATTTSNGSMFFKLYDSTDDAVSFYILYVREGTWNFGLKHPNSNTSQQTTMSISLERCPRKCSSHGTCQSVFDASGLILNSYCWCDRNHGGFDCSIELVSHRKHIWQSIFLIVSNVAAVLPAYLALRKKAFAEWVLFTSSGISSGLYHACDVGTWCALSFRVLQFLDFWLSFMAVVSTFVYLASINEVSKRAIHTIVAILTALMAETGPTRSSNVVIVVAIGALGLLIGWLIELCTKYRSFPFNTESCLNILERWRAIKGWIHNLINTLRSRFRWGFVLAGFMALAMAAISWRLETSETYWIWHSIWHVSIYTSSFLFLCSKANIANCETPSSSPPDGRYVLTRQDSFSRGG